MQHILDLAGTVKVAHLVMRMARMAVRMAHWLRAVAVQALGPEFDYLALT